MRTRTRFYVLHYTLAVIASLFLLPVTQAATNKTGAHADAATISFFNRDIAVLRDDFLGVSPQVRAQRAQERLADLVTAQTANVVATHTIPQGVAIQVDGKLAFIITPADLDALTDETLADATQKTVAALSLAIAETREGRNFDALGRSSVLVLLATLAAVILHRLLRAARNFMIAWLDKKVDLHLEKVRLGNATILSREHTLAALTRAVNFTYLALNALIAYVWVGHTLGRFPFTRAWGEGLNAYLLEIASTIIGGILSSLPNLFIALIIVLLTRMVAGWASDLFNRISTGKTVVPWLEADMATPTRRIVVSVLWAFALVMAYPYLPGSHSEAFKGVSVLIGLMVSIGASSHIGQIVSGLILTFTQVFKRGEFVQVAGYEGTVVEIGLIATRMRTGMGEELYLPNSLVLGQVTKNYSRSVVGSGFIVDTTVTIGYDTPWRQVSAMLIEAANRTPGVVAEPKPKVFQTSLSDFYPEYRLVCQAVPSQPRPRAEVMDMLHANIQDVFNEYNVQIMSPHYFADPASAKVVPKELWHQAPAQK